MTRFPLAADQEAVYQLLLEERWTELLSLVYKHRDVVDQDPLLSRAFEVFVSTFFERYQAGMAAELRAELETLFLLHTGRYYGLSRERFELVVEELTRLHEDRPETALGYARHCPTNPYCQEVLSKHDLREPVPHGQAGRIQIDETRAAEGSDHRIGLFRSRQEEQFFMAVREVFASYFAYPNVALSALFDFEGLRPKLQADERQFFFRGVVDCVVFDQHDEYRPRYFFELDSPHHETERQHANDAMKDRILSAAGQRLLRIRLVDRQVGRQDFVRMLREVLDAP